MKDGVYIGYACLMAMLLIVPIAGGAILEDSDTEAHISWGEHLNLSPGSWVSTAAATSDGEDPYNFGWASGWTAAYTTEAGTFDWAYNLYGEVYCELMLWDEETSYSHAWADVSADAPDGGKNFSAHVGLTEAGFGGFPWAWYQTGPMNGYYAQGTDDFGVMEGVGSENIAIVYVSTHEGDADCGYAIAEARAQCWLWEPL